MKKTPDWKLERYLLNELDEPFTPSEADLERIEELKKQNIILLKNMPFEKLNIKSKFSFKAFFNFLLIPKYSLALSFVILLSVGIFFNTSSDNRIKSSKINKLSFYTIKDNKIFEINETYKLQANDLIQISYLVSNYKYMLIFSIDGNNTPYIHYPENKDDTIKQNKNTTLNSAYKLDAAPYYEKFYLVLSNINFDINKTIEHIKNNKLNDRNIFVREYYFEKL